MARRRVAPAAFTRSARTGRNEPPVSGPSSHSLTSHVRRSCAPATVASVAAAPAKRDAFDRRVLRDPEEEASSGARRQDPVVHAGRLSGLLPRRRARRRRELATRRQCSAVVRARSSDSRGSTKRRATIRPFFLALRAA